MDPLLQGGVVQLDVVAPDAPQAGQDLGEGGHDQVLSVTEIVQKNVFSPRKSQNCCF